MFLFGMRVFFFFLRLFFSLRSCQKPPLFGRIELEYFSELDIKESDLFDQCFKLSNPFGLRVNVVQAFFFVVNAAF